MEIDPRLRRPPPTAVNSEPTGANPSPPSQAFGAPQDSQTAHQRHPAYPASPAQFPAPHAPQRTNSYPSPFSTTSHHQSQQSPYQLPRPEPLVSPAPSGPPPPPPPQEQKRPRACESCRSLKVRCEPKDPTNPRGSCRRCAKANRECVFTQPTRKRQKKADSKVAELERKVDALTATLNATRARALRGELDDDEDDELDEETPGSEHPPSPASLAQHPGKRKRSIADLQGETETTAERLRYPDVQRHLREFIPQGTKVSAPPHATSDDRFLPQIQYVDVIDQRLLGMDMALHFFRYYNEKMCLHFPAVVFPPSFSIQELRETKPTLFLSILAVASGMSHPDIHRALQKEATKAFAERIMVNSDKSLELVQALLVMSIWYYPPDVYEELKFYTLIHLAATMALDLGLGKKSPKQPMARWKGAPSSQSSPKNSISSLFETLTTEEKAEIPGLAADTRQPPPQEPGYLAGGQSPNKPRGNSPPVFLRNPFPDPCSIESRRTFLACYWTCSHVSVSLRRPNLLRFSKFMDESIHILEDSPKAAATDKLFCQWIRLQNIAEDIASTFEFDDPSSSISIEDLRMQADIRGFARRLQEWKQRVDPACVNKSIELDHNFITILTHELALHASHNVDDFRPPFTERIVREPMLPPAYQPPPPHMTSICSAVSAAQSLIDSFCTYTIEELYAVPVFTFVRTCYACLILIKVSITALSPQCELGKVMDYQELGVDENVNRVLSRMAQAARGDRSRPAGKFTMIVMMLRGWYTKARGELERFSTTEASREATPTGSESTVGKADVRTPQTPLMVLSNAAVGLQMGSGSSDSGGNQVFPPPNQPWPGTVDGMDGFAMGDVGGGFAGTNQDAFLDESWWGIVEPGAAWPFGEGWSGPGSLS